MHAVKAITASLLTIGLFSLSPTGSEAAIQAGDIIGIDFGPTTPSNNYNPINTTGNASVSSLINLAGVTVTGVSFSITGLADGGNNFSNDDGTSQDLANYPSFLQLTDSNVTDFMGEYANSNGNGYTYTFSGLNDSLTYNFYGASSFAGGLNDITYTIGAQSDSVQVASTSGGTLATILGASSSGGNLSIVVSAPDNAIVNALAIQAVPEPSTLLAALSGGGLLLGLRRRRH